MSLPSGPSPSFARLAGPLIALLAITGLALQLGILLGAAWAKGHSGWVAAWNFFSYFTILSNLLVAISFTASIAFWRSARTRGGVTLYIAVVGLVYEGVLRRLWHPEGAQFIADALLHDAVPLTVVAHWLFLRERGALRWRDPFAWLVYPGVYLAYALLRGATTGWWA
ncbi:MAG TPA: Pr6Pr family membrane protein, partial [Holophagaceae bacterium]|nr:Pr6Pr family membrane protein [Holophagaceae bacterium]